MSPLARLKTLDFEFAAAMAKHRKTFLQKIAGKGQTEKVFGRPLIMRTRSLLAHRWPFAGRNNHPAAATPACG